MKRTLSIVLVLAAILTGCAMLPAKNADTIRYNHSGVSADNVCYLGTAPGVDILTVNGGVVFALVRNKSIEYVDAGHKLLVVRYARATGDQYWYSSPVNISFDFEAGNCYMVDYTISGENDDLNINFFIKEITDPVQRTQAEQQLASFRENLLELDTYLAFSQETPTYLEGTWVTDRGKTLEFTGNKFKFSKTPGDETFSGTYVFDESTIIIDVTKLYSSPNEYMCTLNYKRDGNRLSLSGKGVGLFIRTIIDNYTRSD
jgi:hypothetical protein